jgi:DNA-binding HxlR family transcriptional regulator
MGIRYHQFCPIAKAAELLGERWTILIVRELLIGTTRFNDFQRALSQISPTLLTRRLNQLQECGLVLRKTLPGQRRTEYQLTPAGRELEPVILGLGEWGMKWARGQMSDDELDVELLMFDLHRRIDLDQLPGGRTVLHFHFPGLPKFGHWWIVFPGDGTRELCAHNPGKTVDLHLTVDLRTLTEIWAGDTELRHASGSGRLKLQGDPTLVRTVASWLRPGLFSHVRPNDQAKGARAKSRSDTMSG